ncbi:hypothetical protein VTO73DRAFT_8587 [Trametes versicolor]
MSATALGLLGPLLADGDIPTLNSTYGAVLLGTFFGLILYGLAIHQAYRYSRLDFGDSVFTKSYVAFIMMLDTLHVILCMHMCYFYLVNHYFDPTVLFTRVWSIDNLGLVAAVVIVSCQCFYARRVWLIGPQYRYLVVIAVIIFVGELGIYILTLRCFSLVNHAHACHPSVRNMSLLPSYSEFRELTWLFSVAFALVVVSDIILTTVLILVLHRSRTGIARTDSMLDVLIAYTISTGLLTEYACIFSGLSFIFPLVYLNKNSMVYIALDIVVTKPLTVGPMSVYVNSVIGTLNFRRTLAAYGTGSLGLEIALSDFRPRTGGAPMSDPMFAVASSTSAGSGMSVIGVKATHELAQDASATAIEAPRPQYGSDLNA